MNRRHQELLCQPHWQHLCRMLNQLLKKQLYRHLMLHLCRMLCRMLNLYLFQLHWQHLCRMLCRMLMQLKLLLRKLHQYLRQLLQMQQ
jgi:hypothetical protein